MSFHTLKKWNEFRPSDWQQKKRKVERREKINYLCYLNWHMNFHLLFENAHRASAYTLTCAQFTSLRLRLCECVWMCERDLLLNHFTPRNQKIYQMHTNKCKWKRNKVSADFLPLFPVLFRFWIFHVFYYRHATHTHRATALSFNRANEWTTPRSRHTQRFDSIKRLLYSSLFSIYHLFCAISAIFLTSFFVKFSITCSRYVKVCHIA